MSKSSQKNKSSTFNSFITKMNKVLKALKEFKNHYDKKLNISRLAKYLKLPDLEAENLLWLILDFQEQFEVVFKEHRLKKKIIDGQVYLVTEKKRAMCRERQIFIPKSVLLSEKHISSLSDMIYLFKYVQKGKGFNLKAQDTQLIKDFAKLRMDHPYFFIKNGNNLTYPTEIALELGGIIHSYNKSNKVLKNISLGKCNFMFN